MKTSIQIRDGVLTIDALDVADEVTVTYVNHLEPDARVAGVLNCMQLGARALAFASDKTGASLLAETFKKESEATQSLLSHVSKTTETAVQKSSETMEKAVAAMLTELGKDLSKTLDPANADSIIGKLRRTLVADYSQITAQVRKDLDLANQESPLSALRVELEQGEERRHAVLTAQLGELLQRLAAKAAASAERSKSTRKGDDFEAATNDFLQVESAPRKDLAVYTGKEFGFDQNQIGDFIIEINPSDAHKLRIVLETKNAKRNGTTERIRELDKAMNNRGAAFGISVIASTGEVPRSILPFGDDKLIVHVQALPDDDGWDFTALGVALECARWKALMTRTAAGSLDVARLNAEIERAFAVTNTFAEVKRKITASKSHLDDIAEYLDDKKRALVAALVQIREIVSAARPESEAA
jgi:hypothetical protein